MKKIFWIASYPKSGNTRMRLIIKNIFFGSVAGEGLENLNVVPYFESDINYEFIKKINTNDFNNRSQMQTIAKYRILAQENVVIKGGNFGFFKTHSSNLKIDTIPYTSEKTSLGCIYLVRDPREIAVSYAHHKNKNIDETIDALINRKAISFGLNKIPMHQSSWDQNVLSWRNLNVPNLIIKYEDMLENYEEILESIIVFFENKFAFKIQNKDKIISLTLQNTNFNKLKEIESKKGFIEELNNNFFRSGKKDTWKEALTEKQVNRIEKEFEKTMKIYGYL